MARTTFGTSCGAIRIARLLMIWVQNPSLITFSGISVLKRQSSDQKETIEWNVLSGSRSAAASALMWARFWISGLRIWYFLAAQEDRPSGLVGRPIDRALDVLALDDVNPVLGHDHVVDLGRPPGRRERDVVEGRVLGRKEKEHGQPTLRLACRPFEVVPTIPRWVE